MRNHYDVIVIGGGHAGSEAANAAARLGARVLLVTSNLETIGQMSCNPAVGGIAKGTVVREVDAFGGVIGRAADRATIQFRMLNRSKGPAVWAPRAQCDRGLYRRAVRSLLEEQPGLDLLQATVAALAVDGECVRGVVTTGGETIRAAGVVLTAGTFLRGRIHIGTDTLIDAGRAGDPASMELAEQLEAMGLSVERFKTGTPPRIDGRSVDYSKLERQDGESPDYRFSHFVRAPRPEQRPCWITWAGEELKEIIRADMHRSALYGGAIAGRGPRYCPSIEDKVVKFPDAERHQVFLEPEGLDTSELYVNGLSTSLPVDTQLRFLQSVPGLEQVRMTRAGYAIEYDYYPPQQLTPWLEVKAVSGLFFAGQVNGTTGYEEAAAQGLVAGINAVRRLRDREPVVLARDDGYLGVLVDDLVTRGVDEPYRLFTSRAEFRLLLRQDNALKRLGPLAAELGMLSVGERAELEGRMRGEDELVTLARRVNVEPATANPVLRELGQTEIAEPQRVADVALRPGVSLRDMLGRAVRSVPGHLDDVWMSAEIELKYAGYLERERRAAARLAEMANFRLPQDLPYEELKSLSTEARQKLKRVRPQSLAQAGRIPGVSPSDLQNLVLEVVRRRSAAAEVTIK
ncbi:MAG: tRNA uridine-5-carboxymethylaminomethyl(34) synthesis enzyme MnmG [Gemmatimonadota bacterium]|nr:MAG: tRNA uridine-5-carboxymethylaminomethyl(34) synthesis enzyme MnmG [Gemmatimonadota bacterium]